MTTQNDKIDVLNPIILLNNIGQEIEEIFISNGIPMDILFEKIKVNEDTIKSLTKLTKPQLKAVEEISKIKGLSEYLSNFQTDYSESLKRTNTVHKTNTKLYNKVKHLLPLLRQDFNNGIDLLEDISEFLDIENEQDIFTKVNENIALYKISNFEPDNLNLYAWLKRGELDFIKLNLTNYSRVDFIKWIETKEWKQNLYNKEYVKNLPNLLKKYGVGLVFTPYLNKTVLGAVRWFDGKPLIQISDKGKCLATIWYTIFHEIGHVIKHENDEIFEGNLDVTKSQINKKEKEANSFASEYLFNGDNLRKYIFQYHNCNVSVNFIEETAQKFSVDKIFVAFWMKKAQVKNQSIISNLPTISFEKF